MKLMRVGVDLAKNVIQVHGVDRNEERYLASAALAQEMAEGIARNG